MKQTLFNNIPAKNDHSTPRKPIPEIETSSIPFDSLEGKKIVVTGKLFRMERDEFKSWLEQKGAKMVSSISRNTDLLVIGKSPGGGKLKEAKKLNIPMCYESNFFEKFSRQLSLFD
jgi:DNA ligase (NAD+)